MILDYDHNDMIRLLHSASYRKLYKEKRGYSSIYPKLHPVMSI